ncbi:outer membrane protein [Methylobacterium nigriterrae]|uniref:outer membrane protein n=1 Tax=Methylobacterium nigriterrae TaxID=3127512 RepID=UPI0030134D48
MRIVTFAVLAGLSLCGASAAVAADLDYGVLRGPDYEPAVPVVDWSGIYFGAHAGYTSAALGFKQPFQPILAQYFRARDIESEFGVSSLLIANAKRASGSSFGGFAGVNFQFDEMVLGLEADYTQFQRGATSSNSIGRYFITSAGNYESVYLDGTSSTKVEDFGTFRARAGYAMGNFLPFVTGGLAIGRARIVDQVNVQNYGYDKKTYDANQQLTSGNLAYVNFHDYKIFYQNDVGRSIPNGPIALPTVAKTKVVGGVALGGGLEYALTQNIILRGEYQYVLLNDFDGHKVNLNTVRAGAAVKF